MKEPVSGSLKKDGDKLQARVSVIITRKCINLAEAQILSRSIGPDNSTFVTTEIRGNDLVLIVSGKTISEVRRSLEDLLACLGAAEKAIPKVSQSPTYNHSVRRPSP